MSHLELIVPFGIPPASLAKDLLKEMHTPALAKLLACANKPSIADMDDFPRALSHEYWLASQFPPDSNANSPAISWNMMQACGLTPTPGFWFSFQPVHIHIARDHLVLTDQRRLNISEAESRMLFAIAADSCSEIGLTLLYGNATTWFLRADDWAGLHTATVDAACGHNIDIWMPKGEFERHWRKLQNEIQMQWFTHDINTQREMRGEKVINSVWLSGGADVTNQSIKAIKDAPDYAASLAQLGVSNGKLPVFLADLSEAAINNDWSVWLEQIHEMEKNWFAPLASGLKAGQISQLHVHFSDAHKIATFELTPWSLRKFWRTSSLHHLFSLP